MEPDTEKDQELILLPLRKSRERNKNALSAGSLELKDSLKEYGNVQEKNAEKNSPVILII